MVSNVIHDARTVNSRVTNNLTQMISVFVQLSIVLVGLFWIERKLALLSLAIRSVFVFNSRRYLRPLQSTSENIRRTRDAMYGDMQEKVAEVQVVHGFGQERWEARSFMGAPATWWD